MKVTDIVELSKSRSKIYIDQEFAFVLYKGELRLYHVRKNEEMLEKHYREILSELLPKRAKLRVMNLLQSRDYTEAQLRMKLKQGFYPDPIIDQTLDYVRGYRYVDDLRYAVSFFGTYSDKKSKRRIEQELLRKGISKEVISCAWNQWEEQGGIQDEEKMIKHLLEKRGYDFIYADIHDMNKQVAFLLRKGFSGEKIRHVLRMRGDLDF